MSHIGSDEMGSTLNVEQVNAAANICIDTWLWSNGNTSTDIMERNWNRTGCKYGFFISVF